MKRRPNLAVAFFTAMLVILTAWPAWSRDATPAQIKKLVAQLKARSEDGTVTSIAINEPLMESFKKAGPAAIPYLLPLLRDESTLYPADYILCEMPGLAEKHLDALMAAKNARSGYVPRAIATIGTPRAVKFVMGAFLRPGRPENDMLASAVAVLGSKAVPELIEAFQNKELRWDERMVNDTCWVLERLGPDAIDAVTPLTEMACDESAPKEARTRALWLLAAIGPAAEGAVPRVLEIRKKEHDEEMLYCCEKVIKRTKSPKAVPILLAQLSDSQTGQAERHRAALRSWPAKIGTRGTLEYEDYLWGEEQSSVLRDIAELGSNGSSAASVVAGYADSRNWDLRLQAVSTLGWIGGEAAVSKLIEALGNEEDWLVVLAAERGLWRLQARQAIPALQKVAAEHWYLPVRTAAREVQDAIKKGIKPGPDPRKDEFILKVFDPQSMSSGGKVVGWDEANTLKMAIAKQPDRSLRIFVKEAENEGLSAPRDLKGIQVKGGFLVDLPHIRFARGVSFVDWFGNRTTILDGYNDTIWPTKDGAVVVDLPVDLVDVNDNGMAFKITHTPDRGWTAERWRRLPGLADFSTMLKDGSLFVNCSRGMVLISPDGSMKSISAPEALELK